MTTTNTATPDKISKEDKTTITARNYKNWTNNSHNSRQDKKKRSEQHYWNTMIFGKGEGAGWQLQ